MIRPCWGEHPIVLEITAPNYQKLFKQAAKAVKDYDMEYVLGVNLSLSEDDIPTMTIMGS